MGYICMCSFFTMPCHFAASLALLCLLFNSMPRAVLQKLSSTVLCGCH